MTEHFIQALITLIGLLVGAATMWIKTSAERKISAARLIEAEAKLVEAQLGRGSLPPANAPREAALERVGAKLDDLDHKHDKTRERVTHLEGRLAGQRNGRHRTISKT